jgi:hypothetical protein
LGHAPKEIFCERKFFQKSFLNILNLFKIFHAGISHNIFVKFSGFFRELQALYVPHISHISCHNSPI